MASPFPASTLSRRFLHELERGPPSGLQGALLASRHGTPLAVAADLADPEAFCAMHATALGAAEVAFARVGAHTEVSLIAETEGRRFVSRTLQRGMFVVAVVSMDASCREVLEWMGALDERLGS